MLLDSISNLQSVEAGQAHACARPSSSNGSNDASKMLAKLIEMIEAENKSRTEMLAARDQTKMPAVAQLDARVDGVDRRLDEMKQLLGTSQETIVSEIQRMLDMQQQSMRASLDAVLQATSGAAVAERPA